jgi:hypothetical protein
MAGPSSPVPDGDDKKIADADWLRGDAPGAKPKATPAGKPRVEDVDHSYDVVEGEDERAEAAAPVPPTIPVRAAPRKPKPKAGGEGEASAPASPPATVEEVWSRGAEWGGHLVLIAIVAAVIGVLIYFAMAATQFLIAFLVAGLGGAALLALCYPIFITLERPVRITPEQAAKDYYAMLSHILPHYRRMWLLLSSAGKVSGEFSSFEEFQSYWKRTLARLQGGKPSPLNPLKFEVAEFNSEKSAGMTVLTAKFTIKVYRGEPSPASEVASYLISSGLVKGPDRMWYLNNGTLPPERK